MQNTVASHLLLCAYRVKISFSFLSGWKARLFCDMWKLYEIQISVSSTDWNVLGLFCHILSVAALVLSWQELSDVDSVWPEKPEMFTVRSLQKMLTSVLTPLTCCLCCPVSEKALLLTWPSGSFLAWVLQFVTEKPKTTCRLVPWRGRDGNIERLAC